MTTANRLAKWLDKGQCRFALVRHPDAPDPRENEARDKRASVPRDRLARTVLLEDQRGYVAVMLPATHHLKLAELRAQTGRPLTRARADGVREMFRDCDSRALPPGIAYGMPTWIEEGLLTAPDIYFEAGDRQQLVHMRADAFAVLAGEAGRGHFSHRMM